MLWARLCPLKVDDADTPFMSAAAMPHRDTAGVITAAFGVAFFREGECLEGATAPEVWVVGAAEMPSAGGYGGVGVHVADFGGQGEGAGWWRRIFGVAGR
jgi:hypothetical protein